ncbi:MAG: GNAT family N-acetyltransferase [Saprospiraceae bacterium]|nr:GNAT family N-acetyltransferase [Saprospiraceae bacterium]
MGLQFPVLTSDRLILRQIKPEDAPVVLEGYGDTRVNLFMSVAYHTLEEVQVQLDWYTELLEKQTGIWWGICMKDTGQMIGNGGYHKWEHQHRCAELGYWLLPEYQGKGYAAEAVKVMLDYGFSSMDLHRIEAIVEGGNQASSLLLKRLDFDLEGIRKECEFIKGRFIDLEIWAKLNK